MKEIAFLVPSIYTYGGQQRVVSVIINELNLRNCHITVYTSDERVNNIYSISEAISIKYFNHRQYRKELPIKIIRYIDKKYDLSSINGVIELCYYDKAAKRLLSELGRNNYDIVIAVGGYMTILLGMVAEKTVNKKTRFVAWEHNTYEAYFETPNKYLWKRKGEFGKYVKNIDNIIVLNEDIKSKYDTCFGVNCDVIPNPRSFVSESKSLCENKIFVACGRFVDAKGFDMLLEAFKLFTKHNSDWKLMLIGDGVLSGILNDIVKNACLEDRVIFTGFVDDVKEKMLEGSVFLLSSRWEGFPMSVVEAYEVGLPAISFDISGMQPLSKNNECILVQCYNVKDYAEAMINLAENNELRKKMSQNAMSTAKMLSVDNIGKKWNQILNI